MGPVRVGNQAQEHFQHDVYGNILLGAAQAFHDHRLLKRAGRAEFAHMEAVGEQAFKIYDTPDAGMWELRTRARIHTSSALMSWAACDRLAKIASALGLPERIRHWRERADMIRGRILKESWSEQRQAFAESFGGRDLDASALLMANYLVLVEAWRRVLLAWGAHVPFAEASRVWFVSNLGKYVPGKVWQLSAMTVMLREHGIPALVAGAAAVRHESTRAQIAVGEEAR
jgi:hypothetical protein